MRIFLLIWACLFSGIACANPPPYEFYLEKDAKGVSGKVVIQGEGQWHYVGNVKDGKPHGNGVKVLEGGMLQYGEWVNGMFKGDGAVYVPTPFNSLEAGYYDDDKIVGDAAVIIMEGETYQGPYGRMGLPHGKGVCIKAGVKKECTYDHGAKVE
ncbi:hypothetical protein A9Q99_17415 [Gammaproteobacteria bacterium 45_16_T64]|nr:hypothetical protein A9Q99_17415 [Gammaproteobacteria bacterium 45_16_T64]